MKTTIKGFNIVQIGTGGIGGYIVYLLSRFLFTIQETRVFSYTLVDGDKVAEHNLLRQNFIQKDIDLPKPAVLAPRYGSVFGLKIGAINDYIHKPAQLKHLLEYRDKYCINLPVLIGAVDNNATRQIMDKVFNEMDNIVYIDAGNGTATDDPEDNEQWTGQVVVGFKADGKVILPPVGKVYPDILVDATTRLPGLSCGEVQASQPQLMLTNVRAADIVFSYLVSILKDGIILNHYTTYNAQTNLSRPHDYPKTGIVNLKFA